MMTMFKRDSKSTKLAILTPALRMTERSKNFEEVKVGIYKKEKKNDHVEEFSYYVDSNRNVAVLLDSNALANEKKSKGLHGEKPQCLSSTLYFKQAKHFMRKKQHEKALSYLQKAIGLTGSDDTTEEDALGELNDNSKEKDSIFLFFQRRVR